MKKNNKKKVQTKLSKSKKGLFWFITIAFPFAFIIILEILLQLFNYGGNLDLFIEGPAGYENYLRCNPDVAKRYFYNEKSVPTPPQLLFRKEKKVDAFRIFVLGGSSAAGFPYRSNASFPSYLQRALSKSFPNKEVEVINIAMAAINSYTLLDLTDEVLEQKPDALLIYAGHNEFYGALGVGSVQSLGNSSWIINSYLSLQSFRTLRLLRDFIGWIKFSIDGLFNNKTKIDSSSTLMSRIVGEQTIPYNSELYNAGKMQFSNNLDAILKKAATNNVKVILAELVSNLKDQKPFIDVDGEFSASKSFALAKTAENDSNFTRARTLYTEAKDYDALRFRAPEDFNEIIHELGNKYNFPVVQTKKYFEALSKNGLIGNSLFLEHLHPNKEGYNLLAKAFFEKIVNTKIMDEDTSSHIFSILVNGGLTQLDSVYDDLVIQHLKSGWPFKEQNYANDFFQKFNPKNDLEKLSLRIMQSPNINIEVGHLELGENYEKSNQFELAYQEFNALITCLPTEIEFYQRAATILIQEKKYQAADSLLKESLKYKDNIFAYKWIGQIALINKDYENAIKNLKYADQNDEQVIFNLSRACYEAGLWNVGEQYFQKLGTISKNSGYISFLKKLRIISKVNSKN